MTNLKPALLALADGSVFEGVSIGIDGKTVGEVVFNTAMTGYQEILTDTSYRQQIVTLTYPHIGNVGVNAEDAESGAVQLAGLVMWIPGGAVYLLAAAWVGFGWLGSTASPSRSTRPDHTSKPA